MKTSRIISAVLMVIGAIMIGSQLPTVYKQIEGFAVNKLIFIGIVCITVLLIVGSVVQFAKARKA
ncbi:hypothetical protein KC866_01670 [Patescibacteria group bacterium]|nr:hypothetical protein [Patescibacteria group bacterium]